MKTIGWALGALTVSATAAAAGGIERSVTSPAILFEKGDYVELSFGSVSPDVSGTQVTPLYAMTPGGPVVAVPAGGKSGDMAGDYVQFSLGIKTALTDRLDLAVILDQPIGAKVNYRSTTLPPYAYGAGPGSQAEVESTGLTAMLRYKLDGGFSVYGGIKGEQASGKVSLFNGYTMTTSTETDFGFLAGVAYERPDIALRVALTYLSDITHKFDSVENGSPSAPFETTVPQQLTLDFQSGIAKDTLLFGSIRWRDWSEFDITPIGYQMATGDSLVSYAKDTVTYTLGVGRRFNENWAGAITLAHEPAAGGFSGNLGPHDGLTSIGLGVTYTKDQWKISGGVTYAKIGGTKTENPSIPGADFGDFKDNHTVGVGFRVGYSF